jgi:hypothetical protein
MSEIRTGTIDGSVFHGELVARGVLLRLADQLIEALHGRGHPIIAFISRCGAASVDYDDDFIIRHHDDLSNEARIVGEGRAAAVREGRVVVGHSVRT